MLQRLERLEKARNKRDLNNSNKGAIMGKVIPFPGTKLSDEQMEKNRKLDKQEQLKEHIVNTSLDISLGVFNKFDMSHLPQIMFNDTNKKDFVLIHEAIKSAICRLYNVKHELQEVQHDCIDLALSDIEWLDDDNNF